MSPRTSPDGRHTIADNFQRISEAWLVCTCGVRIRTEGLGAPELLYDEYQRHRSEVGATRRPGTAIRATDENRVPFIARRRRHRMAP